MNAQHASEPDFSTKTFLVIDDFPGMRNMLRDILRGCGANPKSIETAANGREAVTRLETEKFDVVLCDFNLGNGKNGQQVLEEAKFRELIGPACAWIMITAEKTTDVVTSAAEYQPDSYLLKPITEATLRQRLSKIWAKKAAFSEIDAALRRHDLAQAIRLCEQRLAVDKANAADLQRLRCDLLLSSADLDLARQAYADVLAVREVPWARLGMARLLFQNGESADARAQLEDLVKDHPTYLEAYDWLAKALQADSAVEAAEQILERAARLSPNSVLRQKALGDVALKLGKLDQAERAFRKSVSLGEHSALKTADAYLGLAKTCSAKQSPDEALRVLGSLNKAFDASEVRLKSLAVEGQVHQQSGNQALAGKAAKELGELMSSGAQAPDAETTLEIARLLLATGDHDGAVSLLRTEVKNRPESTALLEEVQGIFNDANLAEEGQRVVETSRQEAVEMMNRGVLLVRDGQLRDAVELLRSARLAMPRNVRVLFNFVHVSVTLMQTHGVALELIAEARASLDTAHRLAPADRRYRSLSQAIDQLLADGPG